MDEYNNISSELKSFMQCRDWLKNLPESFWLCDESQKDKIKASNSRNIAFKSMLYSALDKKK